MSDERRRVHNGVFAYRSEFRFIKADAAGIPLVPRHDERSDRAFAASRFSDDRRERLRLA